MPYSLLSPIQQHSSVTPLFSTVQNSTLNYATQKVDFAHIKTQSLTKQSCNLVLDKGTNTITSQWQDIVEAIRALPTSQNLDFSRILEQNGGFSTISDFNHILMSLVLADEFELALKLSSSLYELAPNEYNNKKDRMFPHVGSGEGGVDTDVTPTLSKVERLFPKEPRLKIPNEYTYSTWVNLCCKKDDPLTAKSVLVHMLGVGFYPKVATFTTLINCFCKSGKLKEAYEVFDIMGSVGCEPTIHTYNCLLKGLCFVGRIEEAYELFLNIKKSNKRPDLYTFTAVMDGFCKVGRSNEALELLEELLEMGLTPNVVIYNTLFNGYFKEGRPLDGIVLLKKMKEHDCFPDYISYSTLLHGLLKWGEVRAALFIYKEMSRVDFEVDGRMMNSLFRRLCRQSRTEKVLLDEAYAVFAKMRSRRLVVGPVEYELVIEAFCSGKRLDKAMESLYEMVRNGFSPKAFTFSNIIRVLCLEREVNKALLVFILMLKDGKSPNRVPFNLLINELNQQGILLNACYFYGLALKSGVVPRYKPEVYLSLEEVSSNV